MAHAYVSVRVDLDQFDDDDIHDEFTTRGLSVKAGGGDEPAFTQDDLDEIEHLAVCGLTEPARALALELVGKAIGRAL